jgi:predicted RNA-binding protein with PUA-like domain
MWLLKTEPGEYSYDDLEREEGGRWDGVRNPVALRNLRAMKKGDRLLVYHTGDEKAAVGQAEVAREAYPDPKAKGAWLVVVDVEPCGRLARAVTLAEMKAMPEFADSPLVRQGRLSVPLTAAGGRPSWPGGSEREDRRPRRSPGGDGERTRAHRGAAPAWVNAPSKAGAPKGDVCRDEELLLVIKTRAERLEALREALVALHPYDLPELVALPIESGHPPYLDWLDDSVS